MTQFEFIILVLWVMLPPWLLAAAFLWYFKPGIWRQLAFGLLTLSIAIAAFIFTPTWIGQLLGVHYVTVLGTTLMVSPIGLVSAILAWPLAALLGKSQRSRR